MSGDELNSFWSNPKSMNPKKSQKLRDSARGQQCMIRIPDVCNWNNETTVLCHVNGGGMAIKSDDMAASFGCHSCHLAADGKPDVKHGYTTKEIELFFLQGVLRTQEYWRKHGFIGVLK